MERFEDGEVLRKYTDNCVHEGCETIFNKLNKKLSQQKLTIDKTIDQLRRKHLEYGEPT